MPTTQKGGLFRNHGNTLLGFASCDLESHCTIFESVRMVLSRSLGAPIAHIPFFFFLFRTLTELSNTATFDTDGKPIQPLYHHEYEVLALGEIAKLRIHICRKVFEDVSSRNYRERNGTLIFYRTAVKSGIVFISDQLLPPPTMENDLPHTRRLSLRAFLLLCLSSFVLFFLIPTASASPLHHTTNITGEVQPKSLYKRGEVNPVSPKHQTHPDPDMPGLPDFNVLAKDKLSVWDDQRLSLTTERFMPGIYQARVGIANG